MSPGDVVLISLPQASGGPAKLRPALVLSLLPGTFQNVLICGSSTRLDQLANDWDEVVSTGDIDFAASGLHRESSIRLSYLYASDATEITGTIGSIDAARCDRLLVRLASHLQP
ncbi:MAG: type II toxin-antitoxin system PemK/MazF family toxin [Planctomycetota bacterium]|nr:type II toxin-antitoxin system PemK/MazF family toxin [Planctomycetota bacterium]